MKKINDEDKKVKDFQKAYNKKNIKDIPELVNKENRTSRSDKIADEISDKIDLHIDEILNNACNFSVANILAMVKYSIDIGCNVEEISGIIENIIDEDESVKKYVDELIKDFEEEEE